MKKLKFDSGIQEFSVNGRAILRFHPGDPNLYARFLEAGERIQEEAQKLCAKLDEAQEGDLIREMEQADRKLKELLGWVFGPENDFDRILEGVNLLAVAGNGKQVIENLLEALEPVLTEGAKKCALQQETLAKEKAEKRRQSQ